MFSTKCFKKIFFLQANDLEETIKRIQTHKGVLGMMIVNNDGNYNIKNQLYVFNIFSWKMNFKFNFHEKKIHF